MNTLQQPLKIPEPAHNPLPINFSLPRKKKKKPLTPDQQRYKVESMAVRTLLDVLKVDPSTVRNTVRQMGYLVEEPGKPWRLVERKLAPQQWANWMAGDMPFPRWRAAQVFVLAEMVALAELHSGRQTPERSERIAQQLKNLERMKGVEPYINPFRLALLRRLADDAKHGQPYQERAELYCAYLTPILEQDERILPKK